MSCVKVNCQQTAPLHDCHDQQGHPDHDHCSWSGSGFHGDDDDLDHGGLHDDAGGLYYGVLHGDDDGLDHGGLRGEADGLDCGGLHGDNDGWG